MNTALRPVLLSTLFVAGLCAGIGEAQSQPRDFTPGPRMIRFLDQIAHEYDVRERVLGLTAQQKQAMADLLREFKKEMWLKEAVLVGIFQELEDKRRYGLLESNLDYRTANTLTGGIETDELSLFIETLAKLHGIATPEQRAKLGELWHPTLTLRVPQGVTTMIALLSLDGIGRLYNGWRDELRLTDEQARSLRTLLEKARAELLATGTVVEANRVEADDLALTPDVDPERLREQMTKTGDLEAGIFTKLFEVSEQAEHLLTPAQTKTLQALRHHQASRSMRGHPHGAHLNGHSDQGTASARTTPPRFEFFLDLVGMLRLTDDQIAQLVALKGETQKATLLDHAQLKGLQLDLLDRIEQADSRTAVPAADMTAQIRAVEGVRAKLTEARIAAYVKARQILTPEQRALVHPVDALFNEP